MDDPLREIGPIHTGQAPSLQLMGSGEAIHLVLRLRVSTKAVEQQARFSSRFGRVSLISKIEVLRGFSS